MKQNNLKSCIRKFTPQKRRAVAEVISSLLLVVITVVGAVILTTFLDESFFSGGLAAAGGDNSLKGVKLIAFDTRDGIELLGYAGLSNFDGLLTDQYLCRNATLAVGCFTTANTDPFNGGTGFMVIQIENRGLNPIFLSDVYLDNVGHVWDVTTSGVDLFDGVGAPGAGEIPRDGMFSILPENTNVLTQYQDNQIPGGQTVNLVVKLDAVNPDIPLSKTIRVQLNIGTNTLQEFLIQSGGAQ